MRISSYTVAPPRPLHFSLAVVMILVLATATLAAPKNTLWQSSDQFVALVPQDSLSTGPAEPNDHPASLTRERIIAILASLEIRTADGDKPEPLFTGASLQNIAPHLLRGLMEASPTEDVTFAVIGLHDTLYGLAKTRKVTTGRVFYQAGRLNLIVGLAHQEVRDREDRRLFPFTPGNRQKALQGEWEILPQPGQQGSSLNRKDWVVFNDAWQTPAAEQKLPATPVISSQPVVSGNEARTPADRLMILKELSDKGLITADEYRNKRQEILKGL